jgi:serine/threonine protein kinase/Flp pilus assembly protein TadD
MTQASQNQALALDECIDRACSSFEAACKAAVNGGPWPAIEDSLDGLAGLERAAVLRELILLDVHYRRRSGQKTEAKDYQARFPDLDPAWLESAATPAKEGEEARPDGATQAALPGLDAGAGAIPRRLGEYRILREVGRGGMGVVYEAIQESLGRHVALKVLPFTSLLGPTHLERFRREARAAAQLHHTNIVPVFGVGEHAGIHYYAMQYIDGRGLDEVLREVRRFGSGNEAAPAEAPDLASHVAASLVTGRFAQQLPVEQNPSPDVVTQHAPRLLPLSFGRPGHPNSQAVTLSTSASDTDLSSRSNTEYFRGVARLGIQVAEALEYAHRQGILHRDIKPSNLLLDTAGTVWITDFGLAKAQDGAELTGPGDIIGTVRYMAPERFQGHADSRSDVYSLGLTLYEMLTLRAAFDDADRPRLIDQARNETPSRPRQIDARIPRNLETIVLKAMAREPGDRYATAELLAEDLRLFLADRPILARRSSPIEQVWRWGRRNPAVAALVATVFLSLAGGGGTAIWYVRDRAQREAALSVRKAHIEREIEVAVQEAATLGERAWELTETPNLWETTLASALSAIKRAEALVADAGELAGEELQQSVRGVRARLDDDERDRQMVAALEQIRFQRSQVNIKENRYTNSEAIPKYREAFRSYGLEVCKVPADEVAALIRRKRAPVQSAVVTALDDWTWLQRTAGADRDWLVAADVDKWRNKMRHAVARQEREILEQLVEDTEFSQQPPAALILLSKALRQQGGNDSAIRLLRRTQHHFPGDFWVNHELGYVLLNARPPQLDEAITYFRIALALRPQNCGAQLNLGIALKDQGDLTGAIAAFQKAIDLDPRYGSAHNNLGLALRSKNDLAGAIAAFQKAIDLNPASARAHHSLGGALHAKGDLQGAIAACQRAIDLDPKLAGPQHLLGIALFDIGDLAGAVVAYQKAINLNADFAEAHCNLGQALRSQAKFTESLAALQRGHELGTRLKGWRYPSAQWVHEAERLVELDRKLPALLSGQAQPTDTPECIEYAQICGYKRHYATGVRLYQDAFAAQPSLADDVRTSHRYEAACLAAQAGAGQSEVASPLKEPQRADLRNQALQWLRADLSAWSKLLDSVDANDRGSAQRTLERWQHDLALTAVRDEAALAMLPETEQNAWQQFWADVAAAINR